MIDHMWCLLLFPAYYHLSVKCNVGYVFNEIEIIELSSALPHSNLYDYPMCSNCCRVKRSSKNINNFHRSENCICINCQFVTIEFVQAVYCVTQTDPISQFVIVDQLVILFFSSPIGWIFSSLFSSERERDNTYVFFFQLVKRNWHLSDINSDQFSSNSSVVRYYYLSTILSENKVCHDCLFGLWHFNSRLLINVCRASQCHALRGK
jgi:hypothetical protein